MENSGANSGKNFGVWKKIVLISVLALVITSQLVIVVFKPYISAKLIDLAKKYTRGRFVCTLNANGEHVAKLYKISGKKEKLIRSVTGNSCIFSRPKVNAGFFIFASGGGGGATPYESGKNGEIISKHKQITNPVIVIKIGKGGTGTYIDENNNTKTIRFFTHVNWESLLDEEEVESITIPQEYILDGQDYNLTLPKDVNLYGVKGEGEGEDEAGNIKHLYVNGDEYTVVEEPDPDTEPDEGTGEDGTGGTGNPDAGTTPGTPGTEDPTTGDNYRR